jgi:translation initiation factor IF-3
MQSHPLQSPPVARIIKWSKYKYELEKGKKEAKAKSTT